MASLIKRSRKEPVDSERTGKDSIRLRGAGRTEVLRLGDDRWALMHELRGAEEPPPVYLLGSLQACDLALIEGGTRRSAESRGR